MSRCCLSHRLTLEGNTKRQTLSFIISQVLFGVNVTSYYQQLEKSKALALSSPLQDKVSLYPVLLIINSLKFLTVPRSSSEERREIKQIKINHMIRRLFPGSSLVVQQVKHLALSLQ